MANCVIVLGPSGTGKSTSIKGLNPGETVVLNTLGKRLPFKGSAGLYNADKKNMFRQESFSDIVNMLDFIDKAPHVKNIVLDDAAYVMRKEFFQRAKEVGYSKFTEIAQHFQQIIAKCETMREDINVFLMLHSEDVTSDGAIITSKVSTIGKMLDTQYNPVEVVPIVLCTAIKYDDKGQATFGFYTRRFMNGQFEVPAKSPDEMFDSEFIPNDLGLVVKAMADYYG